MNYIYTQTPYIYENSRDIYDNLRYATEKGFVNHKYSVPSIFQWVNCISILNIVLIFSIIQISQLPYPYRQLSTPLLLTLLLILHQQSGHTDFRLVRIDIPALQGQLWTASRFLLLQMI